MASPFPNDGSFLERFKQLQQDPPLETLKSTNAVSKSTLPSKFLSNVQSSNSSSQKSSLKLSVPNGKLAFSLKQKSKLAVNAIKLGEGDDDDGEAEADRRIKKARTEILPSSVSPEPKESGPPTPPGDQEVKKVADKLATFVAKNGRQFENITREKNPGDTPFRFLFDIEGAEYKYYEYRIAQEEAVLASEAAGTQSSHSGSGPRHYNSQPRQSNGGQHQRYQTPASALYSGGDDRRRPFFSSGSSRESAQERYSQSSYTNDSVAMMEFYMKKAAQEDLRKPPKQSKDEMPPPASLQPSPPRERVPSPVMWPSEEPSVPETAPPYLSPTIGVVEDAASVAAKKGHHMGDYIPPEELEKFMAKCNDAMAAKMAKATADRAKIQADNVGHRLLSKMGWKEGEGLGSGRSGRSDPVQAGEVKLNNLGVGAEQPGEVTAEDDIYEQYKKRMMLGYRFRPNPLNNPRKAYY